MRKLVAALVVVLALALGTPAWGAEDLLALTNADRTSRGLAALTSASDLQAFAQRRAEEMARAGKLWHAENLGDQLDNWRLLGENVGRGPSLGDIQAGFMGSETHRYNILLRDFTEVGIGVVFDGVDRLYVAVIFRQPLIARAPAKAPAVAATTTTRQAKPAARPSPPPTTKPKPKAPAPPPPAPAAPPVEEPAPPPPVEPAPPIEVKHPSPRLSWLLEATASDPGHPAPARVPTGAASPTVTVAALGPADPAAPELITAATPATAGERLAAPPLLIAAAVLGIAGAWTSVMVQIRQRLLAARSGMRLLDG